MYYRSNNRSKFLLSTLFVAAGVVGYKFYKKQVELQNELLSLQEAQNAIVTESVKPSPVVVPSSGNSTWLDVQKKAKDTVVQVFAQISKLDFIEPYKTPTQAESRGSGFFINNEGHIVTNYHVVQEASSMEIQIPSLGRQRFETEIIGVSPDRDIALIKVTDAALKILKQELGNIPYLQLGSSDSVVRTQEVLMLGYPLGQEKLKSTHGIVSGRELIMGLSYIQLTAPINPGSSGGPSLNAEGKVIGINNCYIPNTQNIGFIIPISEVRSAINDLYKVKLLRKPTLGGIFTWTTDDLINYLHNPKGGGWYVARVLSNSLLEKVGVSVGDVIYEINGHKVDKYGEVSVGWAEDKVPVIALLNRYVVGDSIHLVVYRRGERKDYRFKLEQRVIMPVRKFYPEFEKIDYEVFGGLVVMELTLNHIAVMLERVPHLMRFTKPEFQDKSSLIITHVLPNSAAAKTRCLMPGAIIEEVNNHKISSLKDFRETILNSKGKEFITIKSQDHAADGMFVALSLKTVLQQEDELSDRYFYRKSTLVDKLLEEKSQDA